ncbi:MAG: shikimate kinase [Ferruginibacter sp.]
MNPPNSVSLKEERNDNFFLIGFMGSGKSHWGRIWAAGSKRSFVDLDLEIEKNIGSTIAEIFETKGEDHFRTLEAATLRNCAGLQNTIIACGGGTPCFSENMQWMNNHGITVYISSTATEILQRVLLEKETRPLLKKLNRAELLFFIEQKLKERAPFYKQAKLTVNSNQLHQNSFSAIISNIKS